MRKIEFLRPYRTATGEIQAGDQMTVTDEQAAPFIELGLARDVETGEQNERKPGSHMLQLANIVTKSTL